MNMQVNITLLKQLTETLIGPSGTAGQWLQASRDLYRMLADASGLNETDPINRQDIALDNGKAIAPLWAAHCILDFMRTRVFLRGILQAIDTIGQRFPDTQTHVLYAGTGPFATLVLPLLPFLDPAKVRFTLLEISPRSIACLEKLIRTFGFEAWIREIVCADATTYQANPSTPPHLVIAEMLQAGLRREPQVAATLNLAPQIAPGGFFIPQRICLQAGLLHPGLDQERMTQMKSAPDAVFEMMGPVFELSQHTVPSSSGSFPVVTLDFPENRNPEFSRLALFTEMEIFGTISLDMWQSGLTQPLMLTALSPDTRLEQIGFQYHLGKNPGLEWQLIARESTAEVEVMEALKGD